MAKPKAPGVRQLMEQVLKGQFGLGKSIDGIRQDFSDFKIQEAAKNATQDEQIATLEDGVKGVGGEIKTHTEGHTTFVVKLLIGVSAMVGVIMSAAGFLAYFSNAARAAGG